MLFAAVHHRAVVGGKDIIERSGVIAADRLALAVLDCPELQARLSDLGTKRARTIPRKGDAGRDDED